MLKLSFPGDVTVYSLYLQQVEASLPLVLFSRGSVLNEGLLLVPEAACTGHGRSWGHLKVSPQLAHLYSPLWQVFCDTRPLHSRIPWCVCVYVCDGVKGQGFGILSLNRQGRDRMRAWPLDLRQSLGPFPVASAAP